MKKSFLPIIVVLVVLIALFAVSFLKDQNGEIPAPNDEDAVIAQQDEETKKPLDEAVKEDENVKSEEVFSETEKEDASSEKKSSSSERKSAKGLFLGMDDSNFLVIFMDDGSGTPKDCRFTIDRSLNFENSDVEIGDSVEFEYETDSKDTKTIVKISKAAQ